MSSTHIRKLDGTIRHPAQADRQISDENEHIDYALGIGCGLNG